MTGIAADMRVGPHWADEHVAALLRGETVEFRPRGRSMEPVVQDNELVRVEPIPPDAAIPVGDVVLVEVDGRQYLHQVQSCNEAGCYLIGNMRGGVNGWVTRDKIFGRLARP